MWDDLTWLGLQVRPLSDLQPELFRAAVKARELLTGTR